MSLKAQEIQSKSLATPQGVGQYAGKSVIQNYLAVEKKFKTITGGLAGVSAFGLILGSLRYGLGFPAGALRAVGDFFGSISSIASPVFLIGNEIINYKTRKAESNENARLNKINKIFDAVREGFYRCSSLGFTPFIFEPFINPEKFGKSVFHKIATVANIPNLLFTGYMWGIGNFKALLAWCLTTREQLSAYKAEKNNDKGELDACNRRINGYDELYQSFKRMAVIGSIANPTMQGLRQCADSLALLTRNMSPGEFFERPLLGLSRLVSLGAGLPEFYAKGVDSIIRLAKEKENLKTGLPKFCSAPLEKLGKLYKTNIATDKNTTLKSISYYAEVIFHTLSPLSMFALFTPLLDEPHLNEEAQARGGFIGASDKILGRAGKALTLVFNGLYVVLGRLPQAIFQSTFFGRKLIGRLKGEDKEVTQKAVLDIRERICKSPLVETVSNFAHNQVKSLVKDFYDETIENEQGYFSYEQIQANYAVEQAKNSLEYKELKKLAEDYSKTKDVKLEDKINKLIDVILEQYSLPFIQEDALRSHHKLTSDEQEAIKKQIINKIKQKVSLTPEPKREPLKFPGAEFLATYIFKLFDLKTRIQKIDYTSSHHNMTTAYDNDEIRISFDYELLPVLCKCVHGLRNTVNRLFGIAA